MRGSRVLVLVGIVLAAQAVVLTGVPEKVSAYTPHAPIFIDGDNSFNATNGVTGGSGTPIDPYIIEGWEINASLADGITIQNTNAHFIIRNVYVHSGSNVSNGITLWRLSNGRVENSDIVGNNYGFRITSVTNVDIVNNNMTYNDCGIEIDYSDNMKITDNYISWNKGLGALVNSWNSSNIIIEVNTMSYNNQGIYLYTPATIKNNLILRNALEGIILAGGYNGTITGNTIAYNNRYGFFINSTFGPTIISYNTIHSNNESGIHIPTASSDITIMYNNITYNTGYGVNLTNAYSVKVHHNNFIGNGIQAYDNLGTMNSWDDGCPSGGNYWSDYNGSDAIDCRTGGSGSDGFIDSPYIIDPNSQDNYPFLNPVLFYNNSPPTVTVSIPNGGEVWTGNTTHTISWSMYDDNDWNLLVWINYSDDGGRNWYQISGAQGIPRSVGNNAFNWTVPRINTNLALVGIDAMDSNSSVGRDETNKAFVIDSSPPIVLLTDPFDLETAVPLSANITIVFSEAMKNSSSSGFMISPQEPGYVYWSAPDELTFDPYFDLTPCTWYNVTQMADYTYDYSSPGNGLDGNKNGMSEGSPLDDISFSFMTVCGGNPPTVTILNPVGGEDWTGGFNKTISWNVTDLDDPPSNLTIDIYYSFDNQTQWFPIVQGLPGNVTNYLWAVPLLNSSWVRVRVCAEDSSNLTGCDTSGYFIIDSEQPYVTSTIPQDGAIDVLRDAEIWVYFNEGMDQTVNGSLTFIPTIPGIMSWNPTAPGIIFTPSSLWALCTQYTVGVVGFEDDSDPGNVMDTRYYFNFTTICPGPPSVTLTRPTGGEYWPGGSQQNIMWNAYDSETPLSNLVFYLNYTSSVSSGSIAGPLVGVTNYLWTLPLIDADDVVVNITAVDEDAMKGWDESATFTIDSIPPSLSVYAPTGWNVPVNASVDAYFDEPVSAMLNYTKGSFGLQDIDTSEWVAVTWVRIPPGALFLQEFHFVPDSPLKECGNYHAYINGTFFDRAGHLLSNPVDWTFHTICPPTLSLQTSLLGKDWSGGSDHDISWTMNDEIDTQLRVWVNYSKDGGTDNYPHVITSGLKAVGQTTYTWTIPLIDTSSAKIRITVMDSAGLTTIVYSDTFTIDSTPPSILTSVPMSGSSGVTITDDIQIVFNEKVVKSSAEASFSITPNPGNIEFSWSTTGLGKDILVVAHKPLKSKMDYTVAFSTVLRDDSDPGNHPTSFLTFRFSTKPPPNVQPPVAKAVGKNQVQVGELITLDGSQSTGNISQYIWTITDNQGNIVEVLVGKIVTYTFQKNGRYAVTLTVIDGSTGKRAIDIIEIAVTSNPNGLLLLVSAAALISIGLVGGTEIGRVALLTLIAAPAYRRKVKGKQDPETRGMIRGYIQVNPGDTYTDIKQNLNLNNGSLTWHLMKLEKEGIIKSQIEGTRRRYYPFEMPMPVGNGGELNEIQRRLLKSIETDPGMPVSVLAEEMGISSQRALYHLRKLRQKELLTLERRGLRLKAYPASTRDN